MRVLAVDPGAKWTGMVVRDGHQLLASELVTRGERFRDYLYAVRDALDDLEHEHGSHPYGGPPVVDLVAVEDLNPPTPHLGMTDPQWLIHTAQVLGAVQAWRPDAVVVPPAGHGKVPQQLLDMPGQRGREACRAWLVQNFPAELVGPRTFRGDTDDLRHCRSAWSIAGAAEMATRQQQIGGLQ